MPTPGFDVVLVDAPAPRGAPTSTAVLFYLDFFGRGPVNTPTLVQSPEEVDDTFGSAVAWSQGQAALDTFFALGGSRAYVVRAAGAAAAEASVQIPGTSGNTLVATAPEVGEGYNGAAGGYTIDVLASGGNRTLVLKDGGVEVARTSPETSRDDLVGPLGPVTITAGAGSGLPTAATGLALASGADDHAGATITEWQAALDSIGVALGPGQLVAPALTTAQLQAIQVDHGWTRNRHALLTPPVGATDSDLETLADAATALTGGRFAALWRDYATIPGRVYGVTRIVPWTAVQAGLIARTDYASGNPNREAAGTKNGYGVADYVLAILDEVDDTRRAALKDAQVNTAKTVYGDAVAYGARTLADLTELPHWWNIGGSRTIMAARALLAAVDEDEVFGQIDGQGQALSLYNGAIKGALAPLYDEVGALYGATLAEALRVDTGSTVNTEATIAAGQKLARVTLKTSPTAEHVVTFLTRVATDQAV